MESGQAVHEAGLRACVGHEGRVHLIGGQVGNALGPDLHRLAHAHPHIGVDDVGPLGGLHGVADKAQGAAALLGNGLAGLYQLGIREVLLRRAGHKIQPQLGAAHHQRIAHVVAGIAHVNHLQPLQAAEMLPNGEHVRQDLGGMELVGQAVPHRNTGVMGQLLHDLLPIAPVLNAVKHAAQHAGGVGNALLLADLAAGGVQIGHLHPQIMGGHLKAAPGAGGGLFKNQRDVAAVQGVVGNVCLLLGLQVRGQVQQALDLFRGKIQQLQKVSALQIHCHRDLLPYSAADGAVFKPVSRFVLHIFWNMRI